MPGQLSLGASPVDTSAPAARTAPAASKRSSSDWLRERARRLTRALGRTLPSVAAGVAASTPIIHSTVEAVQAGWVPAGDDGIITTRGWDVLTSHTPLVGQYSEAGLVIHGQVVHSPGPMLYWLLALPARFGSVSSVAITMGVVNSLCVIGCVLLARRRGGTVLMLMSAVAIALMSQSLPSEAMHDVWNPAAGLYPFLLLIFVGWSLACGDYLLLPLLALLASFLVQTHLMYLAPTLVVVGVALVGLAAHLRGSRRETQGDLARRRRLVPWRGPAVVLGRASPREAPAAKPLRRVLPWAAAALVIAALCWVEPAIDEIDNNPGNMTMIVRTVERRGPALGATIGWHALVRSIGVRPWWLYVPGSEWERKVDVTARPGTLAVDSTIAILAALVLIAAVGVVVRRADLAAASAIALGLCGAIVLQASSNPDSRLLAETLGYTLWWGSQLGMWVWLVIAWALWLGVARVASNWRPLAAIRRRAPVAGPAIVGAAGAVGVLFVGLAVARTESPDSHVYEYRPTRQLAAELERVIPPHRTVAYHLGALDLGTQPMEPAIRFLLVRHGDRVLADGSYPRLGSYYVQGDRPVQWTVYLTDSSKPQRGMSLVGTVRFRSPWQLESLSAWAARAT